MPQLIRIDELYLDDHRHLEPDDICHYLMEYTSGKDFSYSSANALISNFKKSMRKKGTPEWKYKGFAIRNAVELLRQCLTEGELSGETLVPIPPSYWKGDIEYDDRMSQVLQQIHPNVDFRELIYIEENMPPSHLSKVRLSPEEIRGYLRIDETVVAPKPKSIILFDDVVTAGAHFKACKALLNSYFGDIHVRGVFLARRVFADDNY